VIDEVVDDRTPFLGRDLGQGRDERPQFHAGTTRVCGVFERVFGAMRFLHERPRTREEYVRGLPDYHDPTAGFGGAAPTYSALTLRIWLAAISVVLCAGAAVLFGFFALWWATVLLSIIAVGCLVDLAWVVHRKRRGEPG
jgi:hypothetical protein